MALVKIFAKLNQIFFFNNYITQSNLWNSVKTNIFYDLVWLGFMAYQSLLII